MSLRVADRFEIQEKIGEGKLAEIWSAVDRNTDNEFVRVALKIFRPSAIGDPLRPWDPVYREVAAAMRMGPHENVLRPWALVNVHYFSGHETPCLVMEYVEGCNLAMWLADLEPPSIVNIDDRISVTGDLLNAIAHAHSKGVTHHDLSFGNVLIRQIPVPTAVLTDFGCAQFDDPSVDNVSVDQPTYELQPINPPPNGSSLSGEACRDVYAFATLGCLILTGRHPLTDEWRTMRANQWTGQPSPHSTLPRRRMIELSPWMTADSRLNALSDLFLRCVAFDPASRPESAIVVQTEWKKIMD